MKYIVIGAVLVLTLLAACGIPSGVQQMGEGAATAAVELRQTAEVLAPSMQALQETAQALAPTLEAQAPGLRQTLEALAPTLQAQAPEIAQTLEALATEQPLDGVGVRQTLDALTGGIGGSATPSDISVAENASILINTSEHIAYTTQTGFGAVLELYQADMPKQGWNELPDAIVSDTVAQIRYQKGARTATIVIAKLAQGTTVDISLIEDR
jgi:hypothetical protein